MSGRAVTRSTLASKHRISDLALFGGVRAFDESLHVGRPNIPDRDAFMRRVSDLLDRRWLTNDGPYVREFEAMLADLVGVPHCIATSNATIALQMLAKAFGLHGEVVMPSFTFIATAHAMAWEGLRPVFADIDPITHTLDPDDAARRATRDTSAILGVNLWGGSCDVAGLSELAKRLGVPLIFDSAHALGCSSVAGHVGGLGSAEVLSFHATKFVNAFEGGAITTHNSDLAAELRLLRNFGFAGLDRVVALGTNAKMTEVSAAMGITSLEALPAIIDHNRANFELYHRLETIPGVRLRSPSDGGTWNYQYVVAQIDRSAFGIPRDSVVDILWAENILARRYFFPGCHRQEPYLSGYPAPAPPLTVTERVADEVLVLPTGTSVSDREVLTICEVLELIAAHPQEVVRRLAEIAR